MSQRAVYLCILACRQTQNSSDQEERTLWGIFRPLKITGGQQGALGMGCVESMGKPGEGLGGLENERKGS